MFWTLKILDLALNFSTLNIIELTLKIMNPALKIMDPSPKTLNLALNISTSKSLLRMTLKIY